MRPVILTILIVLPALAAAQSGRVKPSETGVPGRPAAPAAVPTPNDDIYRKRPSAPRPRTVSTPTPKPKPAESPAESSDEVIRVDSAIVPIPAIVMDRGGRTVSGLTAGDLELRIDGKLAEIGEVTRSAEPVRLAMLFDNSSSVALAREFEKKAAVRFFQQILLPGRDLACLFSVATVTRLEQDLTGDTRTLTRAIEAFPPPEGATALLDGLVKAAEHLAGSAGRRAVVIVSDGDDTYSDATLAQAVRAVQAANIQVFVVKTTDFENFVRTRSRIANANMRQLAAERRMAEIALQTGGSVFSPIDERELDEAFRKIAAELADQYVLSYYPDRSIERPGEFHEITVTVKGRPDLEVRTRKGYYVPRNSGR